MTNITCTKLCNTEMDAHSEECIKATTKEYVVRYTERNSQNHKVNKSEWFDVVTDAFEFAKNHRPALVYTREGSFIGNFTFKPTTGYSGPASKPNV